MTERSWAEDLDKSIKEARGHMAAMMAEAILLNINLALGDVLQDTKSEDIKEAREHVQKAIMAIRRYDLGAVE